MDNALKKGVKLNGRYEIEKELGRGTFGITYKCKDIKNNRIVAVKELAPQRYSRSEKGNVMPDDSDPKKTPFEKLRSRFKKEADALHDCQHLNIVRIFEQSDGSYCFEENNTLYYVMEYIEGHTLQDFIEKYKSSHGYSVKDLAEKFIIPIAEAVKKLHSERRNHFDIKPQNIMVSHKENGELIPVLIDFGLVKHFNGDGIASSSQVAHGTYAYSPREQIMWTGDMEFRPDFDTYALGGTFYYALTGTIPPLDIPISSDEEATDIGLAKRFIKQSRDDVKEKRYEKIDGFINDLKRVIDGTFKPRSDSLEDGPGLSNVVAAPVRSFVNFETYSKARDAENKQVDDLLWGQDAGGDWYLVNSRDEKLSSAVAAYNNYQDGFFLVKDLKGKFNYIDKTGKLLDNKRWYDEAESFSDGIAIVRINTKGYNYINRQGKLLSTKQWFASAGPFRTGFGLVKLEEGYNYIDANGDYLLPLWAESAKNFDAKLRTAEITIKGKSYTLLTDGSIRNSTGALIPRNRISIITMYDESEMVTDSILWCKRDGLWYLMKIEPNDDLIVLNSMGFTEYSPFSDEVARVVRADGMENYVNMDGDLIIKWVSKVYPFQCGIGRVVISPKAITYIDNSGARYFQCDNNLEEASDFVNGTATAKISGIPVTLDTNRNIIDAQGRKYKIYNVLSSKKNNNEIGHFVLINYNLAYIENKGKWNLSDKRGTYLSDLWFDEIELWQNGVYQVMLDGKYNILGLDYKLCFPNDWFEELMLSPNFLKLVRVGRKNEIIVDRNGKILIKDIECGQCRTVSYSNGSPGFVLGEHGDGYFKCMDKENEGLSIIDDGNNPIFIDEIISFSKSPVMLLVKRDGKYNFVTQDKKFLSEKGYDYAEPFVCGYAIVKDKDGYKYINSLGNAPHGAFDEARPMNSGIALVKKNGKYNFIHRDHTKSYLLRADNGKVLWADNATDFDDKGRAIVTIGSMRHEISRDNLLKGIPIKLEAPVLPSKPVAHVQTDSQRKTSPPRKPEKSSVSLRTVVSWMVCIYISAVGFYKLANGELIYNMWVTLAFICFALWACFKVIKVITDRLDI